MDWIFNFCCCCCCYAVLFGRPTVLGAFVHFGIAALDVNLFLRGGAWQKNKEKKKKYGHQIKNLNLVKKI